MNKPDEKGKKTENFYDTAKKYLLSNSKELLDMLKEYDKNSITDKQIVDLEKKILNDPSFS